MKRRLVALLAALVMALGILAVSVTPAAAVEEVVTEVVNLENSTRSVKAHKDDGCWDSASDPYDTKIIKAGYTSAAVMRWVQSFRVYEDSRILVYEYGTSNLLAVKYIDVAETNTTAGVCYPTTTKYRTYYVEQVDGIGPTNG